MNPSTLPSHAFAPDWFASVRLEAEENTANSYRDELTKHLLSFFKDHHRSEITVAEVDGTARASIASTPMPPPASNRVHD